MIRNKIKSMYRKGVSALILNKKNEVLLVNLNSFEEKYFAIPGGGLEPDETLESAVYREIQEELGILPDQLTFVGKSKDSLKFDFKTIKLSRDGIEYTGSEKFFFGFVFNDDLNNIKIPDGEVRRIVWSSISDLSKYLLFDNQLDDTVDKINEIFN